MLTSTQCKVVAYMSEGGFYCPPCAAKAHGIEDPRTQTGYRLTGRETDLTPIISYEMDSYESEIAYEYEMNGESETDAAEMARTTCEECHGDITD
jgi:uncharacterized Zn finger protein (UPF0148 family)